MDNKALGVTPKNAARRTQRELEQRNLSYNEMYVQLKKMLPTF
jgi:hypothetical protein